VLNHPYTPLLMDVDGTEAVARGLGSFYTAPPLRDDPSPYGDGRYWMPARRHGGRINVAFVGGHVLSSEDPERETWDWEYQAHVGN
jgi:prepilin-type processing-associated H-X9-DG protein